MKTLAISLAIFLLVICQNVETQNSSTITTILSSSSAAPQTNYDSIVKFTIEIDDVKLPKYVIDNIYDGNIPMSDVSMLYNVGKFNLENFTMYLSQLGYSTSNVLSIEGFGAAITAMDISFNQIYENILMNRFKMKGLVIRNFLRDLKIDDIAFSNAMTYGEPDPWEIFNKGNFTRISLEAALAKVNKSSDDLFQACRDEFLLKAVILGSKNMIDILNKFKFTRDKALQLWQLVNISNDDLSAISSINNLLINLRTQLSNIFTMGVITGPRNLTTNKAAHDYLVKESAVGNIVAYSIESSSPIHIMDKVASPFNQLSVYRYQTEYQLPYLDYKLAKEDKIICQFVTIINDTLYMENISIENQADSIIGFWNVTTYQEHILGSPLLCENHVYGFARKYEEDKIIFDVFSNSQMSVVSVFLIIVSMFSIIIVSN